MLKSNVRNIKGHTIKKVYDDTEIKEAFKHLRNNGFEARYNVSVDESDRITEGNINYAVVLKKTQISYYKDGIVCVYFNSEDLPAALKIAKLLSKSLLRSELMWNGCGTKCMRIQTPHKMYIDGDLVEDKTRTTLY